jgi:hypothetical protein
MEKFLEFWSHYNATIIETLVALILVSVIYLAYTTFFGAKSTNAVDTLGVGGVASVDTANIEKTLQKILEQQSALKASTSSTAVSGKGAAAGSGPASPEMLLEVTTLKKALEEKEKQIVVLREKAETATKAAASAAAGAGAAPAAAGPNGLAESERKEYEAKIKELEARLAEYEIISEDIADVSFFKEENTRLAAELTSLKEGGASTPVAPAEPAPAAGAPATPVAEPVDAAALVAEPASPTPEPVAEAQAPATEPEPEPEPAAEPAPSDEASVIDDSLMAEFAKAVEGQKEGTSEQPAKSTEDSKLLEEFENFSKKG